MWDTGSTAQSDSEFRCKPPRRVCGIGYPGPYSISLVATGSGKIHHPRDPCISMHAWDDIFYLRGDGKVSARWIQHPPPSGIMVCVFGDELNLSHIESAPQEHSHLRLIIDLYVNPKKEFSKTPQTGRLLQSPFNLWVTHTKYSRKYGKYTWPRVWSACPIYTLRIPTTDDTSDCTEWETQPTLYHWGTMMIVTLSASTLCCQWDGSTQPIYSVTYCRRWWMWPIPLSKSCFWFLGTAPSPIYRWWGWIWNKKYTIKQQNYLMRKVTNMQVNHIIIKVGKYKTYGY